MGLKNNPKELRDEGKVGDWCFIVDEKTGDDVIYLIYPYPQWLLEKQLKGLEGKGDAAAGWLSIFYDGGKGDVFIGHLSSPGKTAKAAVAWDWDGNKEAPTISPSILVESRDEGRDIERWHGYLRAGELVSA